MFLRPLVKAYRVAPASIRFFSTVPKIDKCLYKTLGVKKDSNT